MPAKATVWVTQALAAGVVTARVGAVVSRVRLVADAEPAAPPRLGVAVSVLDPSPAVRVIAADQALNRAPGVSSVACTVEAPPVIATWPAPAAVKRT